MLSSFTPTPRLQVDSGTDKRSSGRVDLMARKSASLESQQRFLSSTVLIWFLVSRLMFFSQRKHKQQSALRGRKTGVEIIEEEEVSTTVGACGSITLFPNRQRAAHVPSHQSKTWDALFSSGTLRYAPTVWGGATLLKPTEKSPAKGPAPCRLPYALFILYLSRVSVWAYLTSPY